MAGILNKTARLFNLKTMDTRKGNEGQRVTVRLAPGFNVVNDQHWGAFEKDPYVLDLKKQNLIDFGTKVDDLELEQDPDAVVKVRSKSQKVKGS